MSEPVLRDRASGFTLEIINTLLKDAWVEGYWAGRNETQEEIHQAGWDGGYAAAQRAWRGKVDQVIRGNLNHVVNGLTEIAQRRTKTTIASEREWMADKAASVEMAIRDLIGERVK